MTRTGRKHTIRLTDAEQFFYDHAVFFWNPDDGEDAESGRIRRAVALARAESLAASRETVVSWEPDCPGGDLCVCNGEHNPAYTAILRDAEGTYLGKFPSVTFDSGKPDGEPYARVLAAELADEYLF
jgi:hypothetical protein